MLGCAERELALFEDSSGIACGHIGNPAKTYHCAGLDKYYNNFI
jgi:hypothetical protein